MKTKKLLSFLALLWGFSLLLPIEVQSQIHAIYAPNEAYLPGIAKKNDLKIGGSLTGRNHLKKGTNRSKTIQYDIQLAYSPLNKVGLMGSYYKRGVQSNTVPAFLEYEHTELAVGLYQPIKSPWPRDLLLQGTLYSGIGWGNNNAIDYTAREFRFSYQRQFIQGGIELLGTKKYMSASFGFRYARLRFSSGQLFGHFSEQFSSPIQWLTRSPKYVLESYINLQAGLPFIKVYVSINTILSQKVKRKPVDSQILKLGLTFAVNELFSKKR